MLRRARTTATPWQDRTPRWEPTSWGDRYRRWEPTSWGDRYRRWVAAQQDDGVDPCRVCGTGLTRCGDSSEFCCGPCAVSGITHPGADPAPDTALAPDTAPT